MTTSELTDMLTSQGRYSFTSEEARQSLGGSPDAVKQALHRLAGRGALASPARGFYVIIPPEYRVLGCLPAEQFIPELMRLRGWAYYAGLLTAAQYHGAAHQRPQEFQVFLQKSHRPLHCGKVQVRFLAKKNISDVPLQKCNTARGELWVSTPEATAIDLAGYPEQAGGYGQVITVLAELAGEIDASALAEAAKSAPITWIQRLGYLLELTDSGEAAVDIKRYIRENAHEYTRLIPGKKEASGPRLPDWKVIVNAHLESDL